MIYRNTMVDITKAELIYQRIKNKLKGNEGKMLAIEPESEDYFIGRDTIEAYEKGHGKYPLKEFFFKRIGAKTAFVVGVRK